MCPAEQKCFVKRYENDEEIVREREKEKKIGGVNLGKSNKV